jgi:hypothetical protein
MCNSHTGEIDDNVCYSYLQDRNVNRLKLGEYDTSPDQRHPYSMMPLPSRGPMGI